MEFKSELIFPKFKAGVWYHFENFQVSIQWWFWSLGFRISFFDYSLLSPKIVQCDNDMLVCVTDTEFSYSANDKKQKLVVISRKMPHQPTVSLLKLTFKLINHIAQSNYICHVQTCANNLDNSSWHA